MVNSLMAASLIVVAVLSSEACAAQLLVFTDPKCAACMQFEREVGRTYDRTAESRSAPLTRLRLGATPGRPYDFLHSN